MRYTISCKLCRTIEVNYAIIDSLDDAKDMEEALKCYECDEAYKNFRNLVTEADSIQFLDEDGNVVYEECVDECNWDDLDDDDVKVKIEIPEGKYLVMITSGWTGSFETEFEYETENGNSFEDEVWSYKNENFGNGIFGTIGITMKHGKELIKYGELGIGDFEWEETHIYDSSWNEIEL